jgi:hypothetical protein
VDHEVDPEVEAQQPGVQGLAKVRMADHMASLAPWSHMPKRLGHKVKERQNRMD